MIVLLFIAAQTEGDIARLFSKQASVAVQTPGLQRLLIPSEVLSQCSADLSDLRVMGAKEIPYVVDSQRNLVLDKVEQVRPEVRMLKREESGLRAKESFEIVFDKETSGEWTLAFETSRPNFLRSVTLTDDKSGKQTQGAVFRLQGKQRVVLPISLDKTKRLVGVFEGESDGYLEPSVVLTRHTLLGPHSTTLNVPFTEMKVDVMNKHSVLHMARPSGVVPASLEFSTSEYVFDRQVRVFDVDATGETLIGEGHIFKLAGAVPIEELSLPVRAARGSRLRIEIDNKDSQPLQLSVAAVIDQPAIVFAANESVRLLFGGGRAARPEYDIASLFPRGVVSGKRQDAAERLFSPEQLSMAELGSIADNPAFDNKPFLSFAMRAGASVDARAYKWRSQIRVERGDVFEGLSLLLPTVQDVSYAKEDLSDLRVVDKQAHQWPYLLLRDRKQVDLEVSVTETQEGNKTKYALKPSVDRVRASEVVLDSDAPFFDRKYQLLGKTNEVIAEGRIRREANTLTPVLVRFSARDVGALTLVIDNGNDAPLLVTRAAYTASLPALYLAAPTGEYFLLAGNPADVAPSYELERIADAVLALPATEATPIFAEVNPDYASVTRLSQGPGPLQFALWAAIVLAVVGLAALTLRLAKQD